MIKLTVFCEKVEHARDGAGGELYSAKLVAGDGTEVHVAAMPMHHGTQLREGGAYVLSFEDQPKAATKASTPAEVKALEDAAKKASSAVVDAERVAREKRDAINSTHNAEERAAAELASRTADEQVAAAKTASRQASDKLAAAKKAVQ